MNKSFKTVSLVSLIKMQLVSLKNAKSGRCQFQTEIIPFSICATPQMFARVEWKALYGARMNKCWIKHNHVHKPWDSAITKRRIWN